MFSGQGITTDEAATTRVQACNQCPSANLNSRLRQSYIPQYTWLVDWCCLQSKASKQTKQYRVSASLQPVSKYTNSNANLATSLPLSYILQYAWLVGCSCPQVKASKQTKQAITTWVQAYNRCPTTPTLLPTLPLVNHRVTFYNTLD